MAVSVAIIAFNIVDKAAVLDRMGWTTSDEPVGEPIDLETLPWDVVVSATFQKKTNPHFSSAEGDGYFFVYIDLRQIEPKRHPDFTKMSRVAPCIVHLAVEANPSATVEKWQDGEIVWSVAGTVGYPHDVIGTPPLDLSELARAYRDGQFSLLVGDGFEDSWEPDEDTIPANLADVISENVNVLLGNWFADETGFRYDGDHPPLFRLEGTLPIAPELGVAH